MLPDGISRRFLIEKERLTQANIEVVFINGILEFLARLDGPIDSPYEGGIWKLYVRSPDNYPFAPPMIVFLNKIYHPNIHPGNGLFYSQDLDQCWTPAATLVNVVTNFLPSILLNPVMGNALNTEADRIYYEDRRAFEHNVREWVHLFATNEDYQRMGSQRPPLNLTNRDSVYFEGDDDDESDPDSEYSSA